MTTLVRVPATPDRTGWVSISSASLTAAFAAFTHAYDFGPPAFIAGAIVIALLLALGLGFRRTGSRAFLLPYVLINLWLIVGFGFVGGFWDHAVKAALRALHGGVVPPSLEPLFTSPDLGSAAYEAAWILTFLASLAAAVSGYRFIRSELDERRKLP